VQRTTRKTGEKTKKHDQNQKKKNGRGNEGVRQDPGHPSLQKKSKEKRHISAPNFGERDKETKE